RHRRFAVGRMPGAGRHALLRRRRDPRRAGRSRDRPARRDEGWREGRARLYAPAARSRADAALPQPRSRAGLGFGMQLQEKNPEGALHRPHRRHADRARRERVPRGDPRGGGALPAARHRRDPDPAKEPRRQAGAAAAGLRRSGERSRAGREDRQRNQKHPDFHSRSAARAAAISAALGLQIQTRRLLGGQVRFFALLITIFSIQVHAQSYPSKPIRIVVPYTAGGPADLLVRGLGQKLNEAWGQQVVVENKPGANEIIAAQDIAKSPADGYNYLIASDAVFSLNGYLYSKLPYDPVKDFAPVGR